VKQHDLLAGIPLASPLRGAAPNDPNNPNLVHFHLLIRELPGAPLQLRGPTTLVIEPKHSAKWNYALQPQEYIIAEVLLNIQAICSTSVPPSPPHRHVWSSAPADVPDHSSDRTQTLPLVELIIAAA